MNLILIGNQTLHKLKLPTNVEGSFSLTDPITGEILLNVDADNNKWMLVSNSDVNVYDKYNQQIFKTELKYDDYFLINQNNVNKIVYCTKSNDDSLNMYKLSSNLNLTIGKNNNNLIIYDNPYIQDNHMNLIFTNGVWNLQVKPNSLVYLNEGLIKKNQILLSNGDALFVFGLKIIVINNHIFINNPLNKIIIKTNALMSVTLDQKQYEYEEVKEEDFYKDSDYFFNTPRLRRFIETYELNIANPPGKPQDQETPLLLTLGPMLTMALMSVFTAINTISKLVSGETTLAKSWMQLITPAIMLCTSLLWPNLMRRWQKKQKKKKEKERQIKYRAYLEEKKQEIKNETINQTAILKDNLVVLSDCYNIIMNKKRTLWERKISQKDFLTVRVGTGDIPLDMDINFSEEDFVIEKDDLKEEATQMVNEAKMLHQVPVSYSFFKKKATAIMGKSHMINPFVDNILLQLMCFHSFDELKIVILTNENNKSRWDVYKNAPHLFSDDKSIRFFASTVEESKEVSVYLEQEFIKRITDKNGESIVENENEKNTYTPYYLIITDDYMKIRKLGICDKVFNIKDDIGFGFVIMDDMLSHLPGKCINFITLDNSFCGILRNDIDDYYQQEFKHEIDETINLKKCIEVLSNIPIEFESDLRYLPTSLSFLEMYGVGKVEQLNIRNRWKLNDPTKSLRAALGVNDQSNMIYLDLHEKYHGPHGLIAGTTGSGKSEFIITYILSMCVNYSPNEVAFILIDYKGGGLAGAFENKKNNVRLPHLAGTITNLDKNELNRTLVSIQSELTRRQAKFNEARDELGESTIDIYKYQRFFREGKLTEPMPHLFIVCDEFAELKAQQPEFMDNLISAARIGRSLGVHLILATQKPSGVVNDQIWSNTKFRVCLKVASPSDSNEIIKCPDAAEIKNAGRFFLQVGQNEIFVLGQSGWCGAQYAPSDIMKKEYDRSLSFIDNLGNIIKNISDDSGKKKTVAEGDELSNILKYVTLLANKESVRAETLWLDSIPGELKLSDVINKYSFKSNKTTAIIGEYDDPANQFQDILTLPLNEESNTMIYGLSGNSREMFLRTIIYSASAMYSSEEVNFYIFDFGSETFRIFSKIPHVGDVVFSSETDKIDKLLKLIDEEITERKKLFADYNGEYSNYCRNSGKKIPLFVVIFNNYESFKESYSAYDEMMIRLTREGKRYGIIFLIATSTPSGLFNKFLKNFDYSFALDMNSKEGYVDIFGKIGNIYPSDYPGRGLFKKDIAYEFQTAKICDDDNIVEFIKEKAKVLSEKNKFKAKCIPVLPEILTFDMISEHLSSLKSVPIGMVKETLKPCIYNFKSSKGTVISSNDIENCGNIIMNLLKSFKTLGNIVSVLFDFEDVFGDLRAYANSYCNKDFENFFDQIMKYIDEKIINSEYNIILIIAGVDKFKESIPSLKINELKKKLKSIDNSQIIFVDSGFNLKKMVFESWYNELVINTNGIWIGSGVGEQSVIKTGQYDKKYNIKLSSDFAWVFKNSEGSIVKLINGEEKNEK